MVNLHTAKGFGTLTSRFFLVGGDGFSPIASSLQGKRAVALRTLVESRASNYLVIAPGPVILCLLWP